MVTILHSVTGYTKSDEISWQFSRYCSYIATYIYVLEQVDVLPSKNQSLYSYKLQAKITANIDLYCSIFSTYIFHILVCLLCVYSIVRSVVSLPSRWTKMWKIYRLNTEQYRSVFTAIFAVTVLLLLIYCYCYRSIYNDIMKKSHEQRLALNKAYTFILMSIASYWYFSSNLKAV